MITHKTVFDNDFIIEKSDSEYNYQIGLTTKLDKFDKLFDQHTINEIVLWKVNRFAFMTDQTLELLNEIDPESRELNINLTTEILTALLQTKGIQLPMASTILRFRNRNVYQIIDQRVYRIINSDKKLKLNLNQNNKNLAEQIQLYLDYLASLRIISDKLNIPFEKADRILYMADKRINRNISLDNYSTKTDKATEK